MTKKDLCKRLTDCSQCPKMSESNLAYYSYAKGQHFPSDKCIQNCMIFMLKGELLVNSEEYPGTTLREGQFILQAINSKLELLALTDVEYLQYWFNQLPLICEERYREILEDSEAPTTYTPLTATTRLSNFLHDMRDYLNEKQSCEKFIEIKCQELVYIITCYYPIPQLSVFFYPISRYTESFYYFVMQNYYKIKTVEEFAHLGGYSTTTFRRLFKNMYGEPVYEWMLNKKRKSILDDLQNTTLKIGTISSRNGFDTLSHFAHFCKSSFGYSPRELRSRTAKGENIKIKEKNITEV
ncbi:helix-turn-helix transcriptional regulator [uncultured Bacteroides sp.]|uniref:helix-turn-helix transcriptional regulator n=1 Tax=uncultured Bacteroides sp. TaxID=162156 RepID=UPI002AA86455|nr:helix-turn-helix transcriptional regulator [uncultured Bacteroides sp.]